MVAVPALRGSWALVERVDPVAGSAGRQVAHSEEPLIEGWSTRGSVVPGADIRLAAGWSFAPLPSEAAKLFGSVQRCELAVE